MWDFLYSVWEQPERRYAVLMATLSMGYCLTTLSWGLGLSTAMVVASATITYIVISMFLSIQAELRNVSTIIAETKEAVSEINKIAKNINETSAPKLNQILDETQKALPRLDKAVKDLRKTVEYVNGGAQTASTFLTPVTGAAKFFRSIGQQLTAEDSETDESSDEKEKPVIFEVPKKKMVSRKK